jgi:hypothetical protein
VGKGKRADVYLEVRRQNIAFLKFCIKKYKGDNWMHRFVAGMIRNLDDSYFSRRIF